jgi:hypothetical protein
MRISSRRIAFGGFSIAVIVLFGCSYPKTTPVTIPASSPSGGAATRTVSRETHDHAWYCILKAPPDCPGEPPAGQVVVGFLDGARGGACWAFHECAFRGFVLFDLKSVAGKRVASANLRYDVLSNDSNLPDRPTNCAVSLFAAKAAGISVETPADLITGDLPTGSSVLVPVNEVVRAWASGKLANNGFFLEGPPNPDRKQSNRCASFLGNFRLQVEFENP